MTRKREAVGCTGDPRDPGQACPRPFFRGFRGFGPRHPVVISEVFPVTEEVKQPEPEMKDERDLIIEDLRKRMDAIETDYKLKLGEYQ